MKRLKPLAVGLVLGTIGMSVLHAQTAERPAFLVANIQSVKDQAAYDRYRAAVSATHAAYGGRFIVRGAEPVILDASAKPPGTIVIVAFPSMAKLRAWWNSPAYGAVKGLRESGTVSQLYAVEGLGGGVDMGGRKVVRISIPAKKAGTEMMLSALALTLLGFAGPAYAAEIWSCTYDNIGTSVHAEIHIDGERLELKLDRFLPAISYRVVVNDERELVAVSTANWYTSHPTLDVLLLKKTVGELVLHDVPFAPPSNRSTGSCRKLS